ncbi:DNA-binding transcriptional regulator, AcrR family [Actinopolymorpha cephalotaxi]|uniref:AcrR family transcriptional regulator n=1 Tax=Actinopolymorpha cephalotaxi TaxID=504797 RepID=A0A1I2MTA3_9ACTN|nr:TetR/AcrR family transcriptional regulator [Actinopolymorpha cephalotaxi]NYH85877.1 AcrR family transcriptional regulator [Actinopolymorpha cephalotaxi]SFF93919.1 DNA-binding transcriptional regulator, AcrR family [Actinopolymorpha cephalotaxi]
MPTCARDRLVEAAEELFYSEGIRAVGVERLLEVSGVGRASFYRHFAGKDDLVVEIVRRSGERWQAGMEDAVAARGGSPLAVFDALAERFERPTFRGCSSINAMVEVADPDSPAHKIAAAQKETLTGYIQGLLVASGQRRSRARTLAEQFVLLVDGAIVTAMREPGPRPARQAKAMAAALLDGAARR